MKKSVLIVLIISCTMLAFACSKNEKAESGPAAASNNTQETSAPSKLPEITQEPAAPSETTEITGKPESTDLPDITEEPAPTELPDIIEEPEHDLPDITEEPEPTELPDITEEPEPTELPDITEEPEPTGLPDITEEPEPTELPDITEEPEPTGLPDITEESEAIVISWDDSWEYADYSLIHDDDVTLYISGAEEPKDFTVAVNAGHGTKGGSSVKTLCHPDGTAKVTGGSTAEGALKAAAVSSGTTTLDGTPEAQINLKLALVLKDKLLEAGFNVLMIRESDDAQLDNIARTVYANNNADYHIALHFDSSENDKGFFYIGPAEVSSYRKMEPVASHWTSHEALGNSIVAGAKENGIKLFGSGYMGMDLTQISYSTVASVDLEVGDRASDYSEEALERIADAITDGTERFYYLGE